MRLTYIGMNRGSIKEAHRLQAALRDTRDIIEDCYAVGNFAGADALRVTEAEELASLEMVMRGDAARARTLPQDGQHSYHWHKAMRPYRKAYMVAVCAKRPKPDPDDEENEATQHQAWLVEQGHDYAVFGGVLR